MTLQVKKMENIMKKFITTLILLSMHTNGFCPLPKYSAAKKPLAGAAAGKAPKPQAPSPTLSNLHKRCLETNKKTLNAIIHNMALPADHPARKVAQEGTLKEVNTWTAALIQLRQDREKLDEAAKALENFKF